MFYRLGTMLKRCRRDATRHDATRRRRRLRPNAAKSKFEIWPHLRPNFEFLFLQEKTTTATRRLRPDDWDLTIETWRLRPDATTATRRRRRDDGDDWDPAPQSSKFKIWPHPRPNFEFPPRVEQHFQVFFSFFFLFLSTFDIFDANEKIRFFTVFSLF